MESISLSRDSLSILIGIKFAVDIRYRRTALPFSTFYRLVMLQLPRGRLVGRGSGRWRENSVRDDYNKALLYFYPIFLRNFSIVPRMFELH